MKLQKRLQVVIPETWGVMLWVGGSAAVTAIATWVLQQPDLIKWYGVVNVVLYFLAELKKTYDKK